MRLCALAVCEMCVHVLVSVCVSVRTFVTSTIKVTNEFDAQTMIIRNNAAIYSDADANCVWLAQKCIGKI